MGRSWIWTMDLWVMGPARFHCATLPVSVYLLITVKYKILLCSCVCENKAYKAKDTNNFLFDWSGENINVLFACFEIIQHQTPAFHTARLKQQQRMSGDPDCILHHLMPHHQRLALFDWSGESINVLFACFEIIKI